MNESERPSNRIKCHLQDRVLLLHKKKMMVKKNIKMEMQDMDVDQEDEVVTVKEEKKDGNINKKKIKIISDLSHLLADAKAN